MRRTLARWPVILGALAGQVSGTLTVIGYAIHCAEDALRLDIVWYGGTIAIFALGGAAMGSTWRATARQRITTSPVPLGGAACGRCLAGPDLVADPPPHQ